MVGRVITETFGYDGGRQATAYVPPQPPEALVFVADGGWHAPRLAEALGESRISPVMLVGIDGLPDDDARLKEYSLGFDPERFAAHERFFVEDVRLWAASLLGAALPAARTAVWGASAGGELALALGLRHPDAYGVVFCASPGGGYQPTVPLPRPLPRAYLVGGTEEPWFLANARRWAGALADAGGDVVMHDRAGGHGHVFWYEELAPMLRWAFGPA